MAHRLFNAARSLTAESGLSSTDKLVLMMLADRADDQGRCWPSVPCLMSDTLLCERAVRKAIAALQELGFVTVVHRSGLVSSYHLDLSPTPAPRAGVKDPCTTCTPAPHAPLPLHHMQGTPAPHAPTPAPRAGLHYGEPPRTVSEPPGEPEPKTLKPMKPAASSPNSQKPEFELSGEAMPKIAHLNGVPYAKIVAAYHRLLPMCPHVAKLTDARKSALRARWHDLLDDVGEWEDYFAHVAKSRFLTGQAQPPPGRKAFRADLEWLAKESNFVKVMEGKYDG